uniref:glycosyltransferase family 2 protein n=1 Tax=uncultured Christiangramia sp. TaxID=503836 RepID=UPI0026048ECD|nr:glycosyltransferase [uncultured Christiangramia sp.]
MKYSLIICTYNRAESLIRLLKSIKNQEHYPDEVLIIDGSEGDETKTALLNSTYKNISYHQVDNENRGLTKQRNIGIEYAHKQSEIICFLDDDIIVTKGYFKNLIDTFDTNPDAMGVGGAIINEGVWSKIEKDSEKKFEKYYRDGYVRSLGARNVLRKKLGLLSAKPPGIMPKFSNGFSIGFYPPNDKIHKVDYFMGGVSAYRKSLFDSISFSEYFIGYGLYEDMEFCLRASRIGSLYINTSAQVYHLHEEAGRPDYYKYGKMVVANGWIVWKIKYPKPDITSVIKWNAIVFILACIRLKNGLVDREKGAVQDAMGRFSAWFKMTYRKPQYSEKKGRSSKFENSFI